MRRSSLASLLYHAHLRALAGRELEQAALQKALENLSDLLGLDGLVLFEPINKERSHGSGEHGFAVWEELVHLVLGCEVSCEESNAVRSLFVEMSLHFQRVWL